MLRSLLVPTALSALAAVITLPGCSSSGDAPATLPSPTKTETYLGLETPTDGFQVRNQGTTIPAGGDEEYCEVAELPGDSSRVYFANDIEMGNGKGSHHLIVVVAPPGSKSDAKMRSMRIGDRVPCVSAEMAFGQDIESVGGIQHPYGRMTYPAGIAKKYFGGQRLVFDYHYFNASEVPVDARSAVNFHLVDEKKVRQLSSGFGFLNWTIDTPAGKSAAFTAECRFQKDALVGGLSRHTHKWGRDFSAWFAGGSRDGELIWTTPSFEANTDHPFDTPVLVKAGDGFEFQCNFENTEDHPLRFGTSASDEMCILFGSTWDAAGAFESPEEKCDITWIDPDGVGRDTTAPGAFPPPTAGEAAACLGGAGAAAETDRCTQCACNSCGGILIKCYTDPDCGPIAQCPQGTDCESVIEAHSSGVGLSRQVGACVESKCAASCGAKAGTADGGVQ